MNEDELGSWREHSVHCAVEINEWMSRRRVRCYHLSSRVRAGMTYTYLALTERSVGVGRLEIYLIWSH